MSNFIYNGKVFNDGDAVISPDDRSFRFGDGVFETMRVENGNIRFADQHFHRLFTGLELLQIKTPKLFSASHLSQQVIELCKKNDHAAARVRLTVSRGMGGLYDDAGQLNYVIQSWPLDPIELNENGLVIDVYEGARKCCDRLANCKTNNFLPYVMAALEAKNKKLNDCIVLNEHGRICDTTIANIFIIKEDVFETPSLDEGCIAGVMRAHIIHVLNNSGYTVIEKEITIEDIENASEVFLSNSIKGIRWVKQFRGSSYKNIMIKKIFPKVIESAG
jgi:branched-chain amino acid aminotransferase